MLDATHDQNDRAVIGGNNPPEQTALETWEAHAESLRERAVGIVITNEDQAEVVATLIKDAKAAFKDIKSAITEARRPYMEAADKVSESFAPAKDSIEAVKRAGVNAESAWKDQKEAERQAALTEARRREREAQEEAARIAAQADPTEADDIEAQREAEKSAAAASMEAKKLATAKPISGGSRTMTRYTGEITDERALWAYIHKTAPDDLRALLQQWVDGAVRSGAREIDGVKIHSRKERV